MVELWQCAQGKLRMPRLFRSWEAGGGSCTDPGVRSHAEEKPPTTSVLLRRLASPTSPLWCTPRAPGQKIMSSPGSCGYSPFCVCVKFLGLCSRRGENSQIQEKLECVWVESGGLFNILLFWLPLPNVYLVLPFLLLHAYTVNAYEFTGDSPFVGCCMSPSWVIQHKQWIIPRGEKRKSQL